MGRLHFPGPLSARQHKTRDFLLVGMYPMYIFYINYLDIERCRPGHDATRVAMGLRTIERAGGGSRLHDLPELESHTSPPPAA